jgi:hypothetical protein
MIGVLLLHHDDRCDAQGIVTLENNICGDPLRDRAAVNEFDTQNI